MKTKYLIAISRNTFNVEMFDVVSRVHNMIKRESRLVRTAADNTRCIMYRLRVMGLVGYIRPPFKPCFDRTKRGTYLVARDGYYIYVDNFTIVKVLHCKKVGRYVVYYPVTPEYQS